ncbi:hypothetical protein CN918_32485 [Priestia megaterium]|nr:hypothetical protein CN918_32485 [Priestia megaterium]
MKNTYQLTSELYSFLPFVLSLQDKKEDFYAMPLFEQTSIKEKLAASYIQDKLYVQYYLPKISKDVVLPAHSKENEKKEVLHVVSENSCNKIILQLHDTRIQLISLLNRTSQESMHAFFKIENVSFTMYDHIERIIWNDTLIKDKISTMDY